MPTQTMDPALLSSVRKAQCDEETGALLYAYMARRERNPENRRVLEQMAQDELRHAGVWRSITGRGTPPRRGYLFIMKLITRLLGFTFVVKTLQKAERINGSAYEAMQRQLPQAAAMLADERRHEQTLYAMLDEERLHYVGAMMLGLNDALVELTGAIAGVTFALANTRLVALTGIITGISATLSMAASNYLAERADGNAKALKSSLYTGAAYLVTVILLVLPYLLLPSHLYAAAFAIMLATVLAIILFFNFYLAVAREEPFFKRFLEMATISLSVAVVSFLIGLAAKQLLGIDTL